MEEFGLELIVLDWMSEREVYRSAFVDAGGSENKHKTRSAFIEIEHSSTPGKAAWAPVRQSRSLAVPQEKVGFGHMNTKHKVFHRPDRLDFEEGAYGTPTELLLVLGPNCNMK